MSSEELMKCPKSEDECPKSDFEGEDEHEDEGDGGFLGLSKGGRNRHIIS